MEKALVGFFARHLPPTIHPTVVHFPIAIVYLAAAVDLMAWMAPPDTRRFLTRAGWWLITAACVAIIAAIAAGIVSEQSVHWTPATARLLSTHQHWAYLTGLFAGAAWLLRLASPFRSAQGRVSGTWSVLGTGRGNLNLLATACVVGAAVCITVTGSLGGRMVYDHGAGVPAVAVRR
ncbi:MAG: hypothetical protein K6V73_11770 [Firmicutes bacterium]|nr:hypothetical protein [Bacillota bacterium]